MTTPPSSSSLPFLAKFYSPSNPTADAKGRTLHSILSYSNTALELDHSYIQLLFPLPEPSPFNYTAPVIDPATFYAFRSSQSLQSSLIHSLERMLFFYGLTYTPSSTPGTHVQLSETEFPRRAKGWVMPFNHNHLRITRILRRLRVLGCEEQAREFWEGLKRVEKARPGRIGRRSWIYWERAVWRPIWLSPDVDIVPRRGKGWLWEWVVEQEQEVARKKERREEDEKELVVEAAMQQDEGLEAGKEQE